MRSLQSPRLSAAAGAATLLLLALAPACKSSSRPQPPAATAARRSVRRLTAASGQPLDLTAARSSLTLRDGSTAPMWAFCETGGCPGDGAWTPGPVLVATAGDDLQITLHNDLPVPTSLVILGQLGGGVGAPVTMAGPVHDGQSHTTFPGNGQASTPFVPPAQGPRVRSFGTEVAPGTAQTLEWKGLKPGTYLYETGTLPSLQVPMGLYGVLVVTAPAAAGASGIAAYPDVTVDDQATFLFSELDPVQNRAVDAAALVDPDGTRVNVRFDDPSCAQKACYPAAVNYAPTSFLINGRFFDRTAPDLSALGIGDGTAYATGDVLVRLANAGSRSHVPSFVGLPLALVAEDGNRAPGNPKVQTEVLLTAGKTFDGVAHLAGSGGAFAPATYALFDRGLALSTENHADGGMQGFLLVNHAGAAAAAAAGGITATAGLPGFLPAGIQPVANDDAFKVPYNTPFSGDVTANDVAIARVALGTGPASGTLVLAPGGAFTYTPNPGSSGTDQFTYVGNGAYPATVTLSVAAKLTGAANMPVANADAYQSPFASRLEVARPGVLANDADPNGYPLSARLANAGTCGTVTLDGSGAFTLAGATPAPASPGAAPTCTFTYDAVNAQGNASTSPATVTVAFGPAGGVAGPAVTLLDPNDTTHTPIADYRWTLQEDLTFHHDVGGTPSVSTRTLGTSFHRSHMPVVATGCVGPVSCGSGQTTLDPASGVRVTLSDDDALKRQATPDQVQLDPTRHYYLSVLPGDAGSGAGHAMGGGPLVLRGGAFAPMTLSVNAEPLQTAQMSIYLYEDSSPTNGQNDLGEQPLGGFNIILNDPAGRTGDVAGQQTFDAFNMPLSNALLGMPGCPDELNRGTNGADSPDGHLVGVVYTCPNDPNAGTPAADPVKYALAGHALIKNLTPARYDVIAHPGAARTAAGEAWWQTETLEGTQAQDAFVGVKEPTYFQEFGPPGPHITIGFVNPNHLASQVLAGHTTLTGKVTNQHMSRPSDVTLWDAGSYEMLFSTTCRVVLNSQAGNGPAVGAAECDADGNFSIANVPPGDYDLAVFDQWLDQIIQNVTVTVPASAPQTLAMGDIPVLSWFTQQDLNIYVDLNGNGVYDAGEPGISNVPLTVRYRNGGLSNVTLSDSSGNGILVELFPLFNWYVTEADTTRYKQTGVHVVVDAGGKPDATTWTTQYAYAPDGSTERTEQPGALSYGIQGFISQRNRVDWGRTAYAAGENGGIVGTVVYSSTRPFDDMRFNVQTIWEPLVPRVTVNLYRQETLADGTPTLTLVDSTKTSSFDDWVNLVQGSDGQKYLLYPDGSLRDPATGAVAPAGTTAGKQVNLQCPGQSPTDVFTAYTLGADDRQRCYDGWHAWNQVQAAPYDGRYVFPSPAYVAAHPLTDVQKAAGQTLVSLPPGTYVVEEVTPPGYQVVKEEDKNILIGDTFTPQTAQQFGPLGSIFILPDAATLGNANPDNPNTGDPGVQSDPTTNLGVYGTPYAEAYPECVGALHRVPDFLSLYPQAQQVAPFAGMDRPLCDRKRVVLGEGMQTSATFFVFTETPVAADATGIILDDATAEFNAVAPDFGEKASVPFVPVSVKDFEGREIARTSSDQWGAYNFMAPSSWLVNPPTPSGYGPNMLITCINDPGPIADPVTGQLVTDPSYNPAYSNFCYTNPYMPGQTTYLDTPVLPIAAFAAGYNPADCALPDTAPAVQRVDSSAGFGPYLPAAGGTLFIQAQGDQQVLNPAYAGPFATGGLASQRTVTRHYGFGAAKGTVRIGNVTLPASAVTWADGAITAAVPAGTPSGELSITTADGQTTIDTVTVTLEDRAPARVPAGGSIQAAIDAAQPGDLVLVDAGTYGELVIMYKPVRLQGVGAASVIINAAKYPNAKLDAWRTRINQLFNVDPLTGNQLGPAQVDPLPGQEITGGTVILEPSVLGSEEGAGITVLAKNLPLASCGNPSTPFVESNFLCAPSRIDGLSVTGGDAGGGIYVNGWAHDLEIANDRVYGNAGAYNGGIRVGQPYLALEALPATLTNGRISGLGYDVGVSIHHNAVTKNGTVEAPAGAGGAGGGISINAGSDGYRVDHNYVCGNYGASDGGGIGHLGFSQGGAITSNQILFNQTFQQTASTHGGGVFVGGEPPVAGAVSLGTGDVTIDANVIRGNLAEGGQGGGLRLQQVNGADVAGRRPGLWHRVTVTNNVIVNNLAGWAGAGVSLSDALAASLVNDTIEHNDSLGIAGVVLAGGVPLPGATSGRAGVGRPGPAGIVSERTSAALLAQLPAAQRTAFAVSQPALQNDILWENRSFFYSGDGRLCAGNTTAAAGAVEANPAACVTLPDQTVTGECVAGAAYWDLGVLGDASAVPPAAPKLGPVASILTSVTGYAGIGNKAANPQVVSPYCNGARAAPELAPVVNPPSVRNLQVAATADEGNNFVNVRFGPLSVVNPVTGVPFGDYHLGGANANHTASSSPAYNAGIASGAPDHDVDLQRRPMGGLYDIGADEFFVAAPVLAVSPTSLPFGAVSVNTTRSLTVQIANGPGASLSLLLGPLTIGAGTGGSSQPARFALTTTCPVSPTPLVPGASCTATVTFAPTAITLPTTQVATLTVPSNAGTATVALSGTGVVPTYTLTPGPLAGHGFGNQAVNTSSAPFQFTVRNTGSLPAAGGEVWLTGLPVLTGTNASQFQAAFRAGDTCTATTHLAPGASCTLSVVFRPTSLGAKGTSAFTPGARVDVSHATGAVNGGLVGSPVWGTGTAAAVVRTGAPASGGGGTAPATRGAPSP